jgi:hypothetical protein
MRPHRSPVVYVLLGVALTACVVALGVSFFSEEDPRPEFVIPQVFFLAAGIALVYLLARRRD